jgi:fibronectin-binding autotransporter adhesin
VASSYTFSGAWTGAATVNKTGGSELTLGGSNAAFAGTLNVNAGRVNFTTPFGGDVNLPAAGQMGGESVLSGDLALNGGTLHIDPATPAALSSTGTLTLTGTNTVNLLTTPAVGADITVLTYTSLSAGGLGNLAATTGYRAAVFSEPVPGEIRLNTGNANRTWNGGAAWDVGVSANWLEGDNRYYQADAVTFGNTGAGTVAITGNLAPSSITINNSAPNDYTFTAAANNLISGTTGITKSGTGTVTLQGVNTFTGNIQVNAGILKPGGSQAFGANGRTITVAAGATLDTNGALTVNRDYNLIAAGTGSGDGAIVNNGAGHQTGFRSLTLTGDTTIGGSGRWDLRPITAGTVSLDLAGHTLTKTGTNLVAIVDGTISAAGTINVNQGILAVTRSAVTGSASVNVSNGAELRLENYTSGSFDRPVSLDGSTLRNQGANFAPASAVTLTGDSKISAGAGFTLTLATPVGGGGNLEKLDTGALLLSGDNTWTGTTTVSAGTLTLTGANSYTGTTTVNAGTLQLGNGGATGTINSNPIHLGSTTAALRINRSDDFTLANVITGTGITGNAMDPAAFNKDGPNTLTLVAANTYTGSTRLGAGMIAIGSDATVFGLGTDVGSVIDLRNGGIRSADASPRTIANNISFSNSTPFGSPGTGKLTFTGAVAYGGGSKSIIVNNDEVEFSGVISGNGAGTNLANEGPGKLVLSGNNTYTQNTVISQGVLQVGNGGTTGTLGSGPVTNNASLVIHRSLPVEVPNWLIPNLISGTGSLTHSGPANTVLTAVNTYTGDTIVTGGILSLDEPFVADTSAVRISGTGKVELFHAETDIVGTLYLNGTAQAAGLWGRVGAQALYSNPAINETAFLTGDGLLSVTSSGSPYGEWAADNGLTEGNDGETDNPDQDGLDNLGEFALDGDPLSGATGGKVVVKVATVGGQPVLTLTLPVRAAVGAFTGDDALTASGDGVTYIIEGGDTLQSWLLDVDEVTGADATAIQAGLPALSSGDWVYRTFRSPGSVTGDPVEFLRARIE